MEPYKQCPSVRDVCNWSFGFVSLHNYQLLQSLLCHMQMPLAAKANNNNNNNSIVRSCCHAHILQVLLPPFGHLALISQQFSLEAFNFCCCCFIRSTRLPPTDHGRDIGDVEGVGQNK